jgi:hypothetical protein
MMMLLVPSSSSSKMPFSLLLLLLLLLGVFVVDFSFAADPTPCELGAAGCIKKEQQQQQQQQQQADLLNTTNGNNNITNSSKVQKNDSWVVDQADTHNVPAAAQENLVTYGQNNENDPHHSDHHHHVTTTSTTQFALSPPLEQVDKTQRAEEEEADNDDDDAKFHFPLLQERIAAIRAYLHDPMFYLIDMDVDSYMHQADLSSYSIPPSNLVAILEDLEFQLEKNVTLSFEFYALGGWHLVASLVSPAAHGYSSHDVHNDDDDDHSDHHTHDVGDKILVIRAYATSLLGAIVKSNSKPSSSNDNHHAVVSSWVIAEIQIDDTHEMVTMRTTPLNLVAQAMVEVSRSSTPGIAVGKCSDNTVEYQHQLAKECMHALDAFLRNNHAAHVAFSTLWTVVTPSSSLTTSEAATVEESKGSSTSSSSSSSSSSSPAKILGHQVSIWALEAATTAADAESSNAPMSRHSIDMATRLLALVKDMVSDVDSLQQQQPDAAKQNEIILKVLSTSDWCYAAMQAATLTPSNSFKKLVFSNLQKTALLAVVKLGPHCAHYYNIQQYNRNENTSVTTNNDDQSHVVNVAGVADLMRLHQQLVQANEDYVNSLRSDSPIRGNGMLDRERERIQLVEEALAAVTTAGTTTTTTTTVMRNTPEVVNEQ